MGESLLDRFASDGTVLVDGEELTTPYRVSDGSMLLIAGTCAARPAADALAPLGLRALVTADGRALAALWVADFAEANLGPHGELQFSLFCEGPRANAAPAGPWAFYQALARTEPPWMVCHRLWNTSERVVRYNDVHLGLEVNRAEGGLHRVGAWRFGFTEGDGRILARGAVELPSRTSLADGWSLGRALGTGKLFRLRRGPSSISVVSPRLTGSCDLQVSQTFTRAASVIRRWSSSDQLELVDPALVAMGFVPDLVTAFTGVEFVYLRPEPQPSPAGSR